MVGIATPYCFHQTNSIQMNSFLLTLLRHQTFRPFVQIFIYIITFPLFCIGFFIPKNPAIWVFGNSFGFKDNARYLFEYVRECHPEITPIWIFNKKADCLDIDNSYSRFSLRGIWFQYRAGIFFVSTGFGDLVRFTQANTKIVQFWHAITIKHILLDSQESTPFSESKKILNATARTILQLNLKRYFQVIASSTQVQKRLESAFGLPRKKIPITGYPRHDIIVAHSNYKKKRILYAPTWRADLLQAHSIVFSICSKSFLEQITAAGYELLISIHPLNVSIQESVKKNLGDGVKFISPHHDINIELARSEILITDYSSIAIDFSLLRRKIIFFVPDFDEYLSARGLYPEFEELIRNKGVTTSTDVLNLILNTAKIEQMFDLNMFFKYRDTFSRKRIVANVLDSI